MITAHASRRPANAVYWLEEAMAGEDGRRSSALTGRVTADVCVVGGGYTGLWTAIHAKQLRPEAAIVLIEAMACGFGASGRNGGWATGWHDELDNLIGVFGTEAGLRLALESTNSIEYLRAFTEEWGIACDLRVEGALWAASTARELGLWAGAVAACRRHGRSFMLEELDGEQVRSHTGSPRFLGAVRHTDAAALQPALLVRGLRRVALTIGVQIYESSPMVDFRTGDPVSVYTPSGEVQAGHAVFAMNSWTPRVGELRRAFSVIGSHMVMTEPVDRSRLAERWRSGELLEDARMSVRYTQVTPTGRIAFGGGIGRISHRVRENHFVNPSGTARLCADIGVMFPSLTDVGVTHGWGGPVDFSADHLPFVSAVHGARNIHAGLGFSGNGVAPSVHIGKILAALATETDNEHARSPLACGPRAYWPPEPLHTTGGRLLRRAVARAEEAESAGRHSLVPISSLRRFATVRIPLKLEPQLRRRRAGLDTRLAVY
jgi:glycine/D-amino acid oxidase-like deaminating enzyme